MSEPIKMPDWVAAAFAEAKQLADAGNARWSSSIGEPREFDGFQVTPGGDEENLQFASVLYGGRTFIGTAAEVRAAQRAYVLSRSKQGKAARRAEAACAPEVDP